MTEYFSHDYDARDDDKIQDLLYKHSWIGYGLYWAIIEDLYKNDGYMQTHYERIAHKLNTEEEIVRSIIEDFKLFRINKNKFTSNSVLKRLSIRQEKSDKARDSANKRWHPNVMRTQSDSNAKKESKGKEIKEKNIKRIFDENYKDDKYIERPK